jgi:hypothetical protein
MSFVEKIADRRLIELYLYWDRLRGNRFAPSRREVDPAAIPLLLPHLLITELVGEPARCRFRLVGTEVERHFGTTMTGRFVDELMRGEYLAFIKGLYWRLASDRVPVYSENTYGSDGGWDAYSDVFRTSRLLLPLSSDGRRVDMALAGQIFTKRGAVDERTVFVAQDRFDLLRNSDAITAE